MLVSYSSVCCGLLSAQQGKPSEYTVKAVYLYNFGKFVVWPTALSPANPGASFAICVLGADPFGPTLDRTLKGESINGQPLVARRIDRVENSDGCRVLFIAPSEQDRVSKILDTVRDKPILTVSEIQGFCNRGGMIEFVIEKNTVRFQINLAPTTKAGLMLSSQLLKVALSVQGVPGAGQ